MFDPNFLRLLGFDDGRSVYEGLGCGGAVLETQMRIPENQMGGHTSLISSTAK